MKQLTGFVALLTAVAAGGQTPLRLSTGLELKIPAGWEGTEMKEAAVLKPPSFAPEEELYLAKLEPGVDTKDPNLFGSIEARYFPAGVRAGASAVTSFRSSKGYAYSRSYWLSPSLGRVAKSSAATLFMLSAMTSQICRRGGAFDAWTSCANT